MSAKTEQLILNLPFRPAQGREDFLVSRSNDEAVARIDDWPDWSGPDWSGHALIISGSSGAGKSHLCEVWRAKSNAVSVTRQTLRERDVLELAQNSAAIIEDVDRAGFDEAALLHLYNMMQQNGNWLLITGRQRPGRWSIELPDLRSRLAAAPHIRLGPPDDALLRAVLAKQFSDRQLDVSGGVLDYMVTRMERSLGAVRQLAAQVDRHSLSWKRPVTKNLVAEVFAEIGENS